MAINEQQANWVLKGPNGLAVELPDGCNLVAGRAPGCEILLPYAKVSRQHARFTRVSGVVTVEDLGSRHGTQVNRQSTSGPVELRNGDEIKFGDRIFRLLDVQAVQAVAPQSETFAVALLLLTLAGIFGFALGEMAGVMSVPSFAVAVAVPRPEDETASRALAAREATDARNSRPAKNRKYSAGTSAPAGDDGPSMGDSAAFIKLMQEMQREGIRFDRMDEVRRIARDKLKLSPERADRVISWAQSLSTRDQMLAGNFSDPPNVSASQVAVQPKAAAGADDPRTAATEAVASTQDGDPLPASSTEAADAGSSEDDSETVTVEMPAVNLVTQGCRLNPLGWLTIAVLWYLGDLLYRGLLRSQSLDPPIDCTVRVGLGLLILPALAIPCLSLGTMSQAMIESLPLLAIAFLHDSQSLPAQRWLTFSYLLGRRVSPEGKASDTVTLLKGKWDGGPQAAPSRRSSQNSAPDLVRHLVVEALKRRATDLHLEPTADGYAVRLRVDGDLVKAKHYSAADGRRIVNVFKVAAHMDIAERRRPQDGQLEIEYEGRSIALRAASIGGAEGEKLSLRLLDNEAELDNLNDLGMDRYLSGQMRGIMSQPHGLVLCCGPTGAGKSTTLRAMLAELERDRINITTIEDPVEYRLTGINQIEVNTKSGQSFATVLRSLLRQDPDVIMVGEVRDPETAAAVCQAASTGHLVLSSVHANDAVGALQRMLELGIDLTTLSDALLAVVGQRLLRRLCRECRIKTAVPGDLVKAFKIDPRRIPHMYRAAKPGAECANCQSLGYRGRIGAFELLELDQRIRGAIVRQASPSEIRGLARQAGMTSLKECALGLALKGLTSLDEVARRVGRGTDQIDPEKRPAGPAGTTKNPNSAGPG